MVHHSILRYTIEGVLHTFNAATLATRGLSLTLTLLLDTESCIFRIGICKLRLDGLG